MAKTKKEDMTPESEEIIEMVEDTKVEVTEEKVEKKKARSTAVESEPTKDDLMDIIQTLMQKVQTLEANAAVAQKDPALAVPSTTDKILEILSNRKSDREVTIIHNREMHGGLTTHIQLTGLTIDFQSLGEQRLLSWQQFEECVSKYRRFFEKEIILLSDQDAELGTRYNVPCVKRGKNRTLTHDDVVRLPKMDVRELEEFITSLTKSDREFVLSYWLGKAYERTPGFYDRYKIDVLNNISEHRAFDNLIAYMNGDYNRT